MTPAFRLADRESLLTLPGGRTVAFRYDANGNLEGLTPPGGSEHTFAYNDVDLNDVYTPPAVAGIADPATSYGYDADRQLTDVVRPDGSQVRLRYDATRGWLDSLSIARGRTTLTHGGAAGQLSVAVSPDSVVSTYDWDGPVLVGETWSGAASGAVAWTLNEAFAEATQTVDVGNDHSVVTYDYADLDQLLTGVSVAGAVETITRRPADGLVTGTSVSVTSGGGPVTSTHGYNRFGELASLGYAWPGGAFVQTLARDTLGRITGVTG